MCWVGGWGAVTTEVGVGDGRLLLRNGRRRDTTHISVRGQSGSYDSHNGPSNSKESWPEHLTSNITSVCSEIRCHCFLKLLILKFNFYFTKSSKLQANIPIIWCCFIVSLMETLSINFKYSWKEYVTMNIFS